MTESQRRNLSPEDRYEYDRETAIQIEYEAMIEKPLSCWIDEAIAVSLGQVVCQPIDAALAKTCVLLDFNEIILALAEVRADRFAEDSREAAARGEYL